MNEICLFFVLLKAIIFYISYIKALLLKNVYV